MENVKIVLDKIFNIRNFIILVFVVGAVFMIAIKQKSNAIQEVSDDRIKNFTMDSYIEGNAVKVSKALNECDIKEENITAVVIGGTVNNEGITRYYFTDKEIIKTIYNELLSAEIYKMSDSADDFVELENTWDIQLYLDEYEYTFRFCGNATDDEEYDRTAVIVVDKDVFFSKSKFFHQDLWKIFGSEYQLIYKSNINQLIVDIIDEYQKKISIDEVVSLYDGEKIDYATLFAYAHGAHEERETPLFEEYPEFTIPVNIFRFPIDGTDAYVYLELQYSESLNNKSEIELVEISLLNELGEKINLLDASENDIRDFCN